MSEISWAVRMLVHPKAVQEFRLACQVIQPIMTDPQETRERKRATLNMMTNELSDATFKLKPIAEQIMNIINMKEDVCREYPDSESQTDGILAWLPRMKKHRGVLLERVKQQRGIYNLGV